MRAKNFSALVIIASLVLPACSSIVTTEETTELPLEQLIENFKTNFSNAKFSFKIPGGSQIDSVIIDESSKQINIRANNRFSFRPFRETDVNEIYTEVKTFFGSQFAGYNISIFSLGVPLDELIPNIYRTSTKTDDSRLPLRRERPAQVVTNASKPFIPSKGLFNNNIALWHSHGWYYNHDLDRWLWQRARLFQIVEDIGPMAFTIPYLVPMLENAGANVYLPRERDTQTNEVVIDNDQNTSGYKEEFIGAEYEWTTGEGAAFNYGNPPYPDNYNPFLFGTHRVTKSSKHATAQVSYTPSIPKSGEYSVYISYKAADENVNDAHYTVYHQGGKTEFKINQQIGGSTWIYLGTFKFKSGFNHEIGKVILDNQSETAGKIVSADAVRFGGGMGNVSRNGQTSGRPKFVEAARYWLQYAGMPDTLVYDLNENKSDYRDDYQSRGEWVNYLTGSPFGPNKDRNVKGLGIPIDLSLAFHTDAGITRNDTTVGTLSIYSLTDADSNNVFPGGVSRMANRDLADILQTQIVEDLRTKYDSVWNRRYLWNGMYSEAARPNVPSVLLELLSHQNFLDVKFQLDPRFRFDVSRSIYKAFLKFIAFQAGREYVVQPLPVTHLSAEFNGNVVVLRWMPREDPLESTAIAKKFIVYTRIDDAGFNNGVLVDSPVYTFTGMKEGTIYSFKVTAVNEGGESFPSEIISVCRNDTNKEPVLIVNGFDRLAPPASIQTESFTGFLDFVDQGVPDKYDLSYVGSQHNFNPNSRWATDDIPGHGASYADYETKVIAGNTFDFVYVHGRALKENGYSFVSCSDEAVEDSIIDLRNYAFVDLILGEEKETNWPKIFGDSLHGTQFQAFPEKFKQRLENYLSSGGKLFVSGAYIGTELFMNRPKEHPDRKFGTAILKYKLDADHAVKKGEVYCIMNEFLPKGFTIKFNTTLNDSVYSVEAPDAISGIGGGKTIFRYTENHFNAGVVFKGEYGVVAIPFPFETITGEKSRYLLMRAVLNYLEI